MKTLTIGSIFVLLSIGSGVIFQSAFADHGEVIIDMPEGTIIRGCEVDNMCFIPTDVTVDVGSSVTWINSDTAGHTVESGTVTDGSSGVFGTGLSFVLPGEAYTFKFDDVEPGTYQYFCLVHTWMAGTVTVVAAGEDSDAMDHDKMDSDAMDHDKMDSDAMDHDKMDSDAMDHDKMDSDAMDHDKMDGDKMMMDEPSAMYALSDGTVVKIKSGELTEGEQLEITVIFVDSGHVNYDVVVTQNGETVLEDIGVHEHLAMSTHMTAPLASSDPVDVTVTFQGYGAEKPFIGDNIGEEAIFTGVVPEFGTMAMIVLGVAVMSIVAVTARSRIVPRNGPT